MSAFENIVVMMNERNQEIEKIKLKYMTEMQAEFNNAAKAFFEACPGVQAIAWTQYTPYFNDGDPCVFSVGELYFVVAGFDADNLPTPYEFEDDGVYTTLPCPDYTGDTYPEMLVDWREYKKTNNASWCDSTISDIEYAIEHFSGYDKKIKQFKELITNNEDLLESMYGDGVAVYLTPNGVIVNEYDHD